MACAEVCFSGRPDKGTARASEVMKLFRTIVYTLFILAVLVALIVKNQREKAAEPPRETSGICTPCPETRLITRVMAPQARPARSSA